MGRDTKEICLLGFHAVRARLRTAPETISRIIFDGQRRDARINALLKQAEQAGVKAISDSALAVDRLVNG